MRAPPQWGQLARWFAAGMLHSLRQLRQRSRIIVILLSAQHSAVPAADLSVRGRFLCVLLRLDGRDVDGLGALVAVLGVVGDPRAFRKRAEAVRVDARVVDEEILAALVRCDEAEALLVAEPLHGSGGHMSCIPPRDVRALRTRRVLRSNDCGRWALLRRALYPALRSGT